MQQALTTLKGIGPGRAELFARLGLFCVRDIAYFAPRAYKDYREAKPLMAYSHGEDAAVRVKLLTSPKRARIRKGMDIVSVRATDGVMQLQLVWYNQPYRAQGLFAGQELYAMGHVDKSKGAKLVNPQTASELPGIVPIYKSVRGLSQNVIREAAMAAAKRVAEESLPGEMIKKYSLAPLDEALLTLHAPESFEALERAKRRLAFEDMLIFSLMLALLKREREGEVGYAFDMRGVKAEFLKLLPYKPTAAQERAMDELAADMASSKRMNRLVQGDVGSGKTAVAMFAMFAAAKNSRLSMLMAPTEILAAQHYKTLGALFGSRVGLITGGMKKSEKDAVLSDVENGSCLMLIGTHALLYGETARLSPALVIADEQHRFGVRQRAKIADGGERVPDTLIMSATPIPRTLALLIYGDLDLSVIDELPPGRKPIKTRIVPLEKRDAMYDFIDKNSALGGAAYAVCPLVEDSEELEGVLSVTALYKELSARMKNSRVALLHGGMAGKLKDAAARAFADGETDVLVATTVIEVGVDVPRANIIAVENAERFGLAQLHQLRGRVGRGGQEAYCFLLGDAENENAKKRLELLTKLNSGFKLAEEDLIMRGPGELLGSRQHGEGELAAMALAADMDVLRAAREAADALKSEGGEWHAKLCARAEAALSLARGNISRN